MIAPSPVDRPAAENRAAKPPATTSPIARATKLPGGGALTRTPASARRGVEPLVDEGAAVLLDLLGAEQQCLLGTDQIAEGGRQAGGRGLGGIHPVALRHRGLESVREHEGEEAARQLRLPRGPRHARELDV